jgi:hypothetical protein
MQLHLHSYFFFFSSNGLGLRDDSSSELTSETMTLLVHIWWVSLGGVSVHRKGPT